MSKGKDLIEIQADNGSFIGLIDEFRVEKDEVGVSALGGLIDGFAVADTTYIFEIDGELFRTDG